MFDFEDLKIINAVQEADLAAINRGGVKGSWNELRTSIELMGTREGHPIEVVLRGRTENDSVAIEVMANANNSKEIQIRVTPFNQKMRGYKISELGDIATQHGEEWNSIQAMDSYAASNAMFDIGIASTGVLQQCSAATQT